MKLPEQKLAPFVLSPGTLVGLWKVKAYVGKAGRRRQTGSGALCRKWSGDQTTLRQVRPEVGGTPCGACSW